MRIVYLFRREAWTTASSDPDYKESAGAAATVVMAGTAPINTSPLGILVVSDLPALIEEPTYSASPATY